MTPKFDIFRIETTGDVRWLRAVETLDEAKTLAEQFVAQAPNGLIIVDQQTGTRYVTNPPGSPEDPVQQAVKNACARA